ncbi:MAG: hypothetical protein H0W87_00060 [Actinobacteria bacterium]|nr:hypothetical protein [Actinomycetota bacterium]
MRRALLVMAVMLLAGCGGGGKSSPEAGVVSGLGDRGITARGGGHAPPGVLSLASTMYRVPGGELHLFRFPSEQRARQAASLVEPDGYMVTNDTGVNQIVDWVAPPHWFRAGREIAIYLGSSADVIGALEAIAGPQFAGA